MGTSGTGGVRRVARMLAMASFAVALSASGDPLAVPNVAIPGPSPSQRPVLEAEWAARLVAALGLAEALPADHDADDLFDLLCPDDRELATQAGGRRLPSRPAFRVRITDVRTGGVARPRRIRIQVPATALYALVVEGRGVQSWSVDGRELGRIEPQALGVDWAPSLLPLARGTHELAYRPSPDTRLERVELVAFRALCIAPAAGWRAGRPLRFGDKARTMAQALGLLHQLPAAEPPRLLEGERFDMATHAARTNQPLARPASGGAWAVALRSPAMVGWRVVLERPGIYTLAARLHGASRQIWEIDQRYGVAVRPGPDAAGVAWQPILTLPLAAGEHVIRARLAPGEGVDTLRLVRHRDGDDELIGLVESLGLREGAPDAVVTAEAARRNLESPAFATRVAGFLRRFDGPRDGGLAALERDLRELYERPLSPMLPADL